MTSIWFVHGAGASARSFTWLQQQLGPHQPHFLSYDVDESTASCIDRLNMAISLETEPVTLIGHSLGGIIGRICAKHPKVSRLITLCAPFGGIRQMNYMEVFNRAPMFHDLSTYSVLLSNMRTDTLKAPHLAIVGTHGLPFTSEPNDGVVTVESQTAIPYQKYLVFELNHFEVLLSPEVATSMNKFLV